MPAPLLKLLSAALAESDADLLGRFVATRDEPAFAELVRRHGPAVYRVCRRLAGDSSADDAFQATFLVLACRAKSVRTAASVGSWLIGVAGRVSRQMLRKARSQESGIRSQTGNVPSSSLPPDSCLLSSELAAVLDDELSRLPDSLRDPVVLCLVDGRTQEQAAAALGGSVRTVRRRLDRAKAVLRVRLERRGIVPAVAAGLVAGTGGPTAAVPVELARRTVTGVSHFLTGGGAITPAAVVAKGVVGSMVKLKVSAAMATVAAVAIGLGVGLAGDRPAATDPPPADKPLAAADQPPPALPKADPAPPPALTPPKVDPDGGFYASRNFVVRAPSGTQARVIAAEAEYHRAVLAKGWLGKELPTAKRECVIYYEPAHGPGGGLTGGSTTFAFGPGAAGAEMKLSGPLADVLEAHLPHEVTRAVLASHFGGPVPRWADEGIALTAESHAEQQKHDAKARELLAAGRAVRLDVLFRMVEDPRNVPVLYAQGSSVARFLRWQHPWGSVPAEVWYDAVDAGFKKFESDGSIGIHRIYPAEHRLLGFVRLGTDGNTAESWAKAARRIYGFASLDELEDAWLDWMKTPGSRWQEEPPPPPKPGRKPGDGSGLIPPIRLPGLPTAAPPPPAAADPPPVAPATRKTANFAVEAPDAGMAAEVAEAAEQARKALAEQWLGKALPPWPAPVTIRVKPGGGAAGGSTMFRFETMAGRTPGAVSAEMELTGSYGPALRSRLPHEVLHTILATSFGRPLPRWADEGIALTAEPDDEQHRLDVQAREYINAGRAIRLRTLFPLKEYPKDLHVLYAQGHSVVRFLLTRGPAEPFGKTALDLNFPADHPKGDALRRRFAVINFVSIGAGGKPGDWDRAARQVYGFESVEELEAAWLDTLKVLPNPDPAPKPDGLERIPPTKLPAPGPKP